MIRHARLGCPLGPAPTVFPLAIAMIEPAFQTLLVAAVSAAALTEPRLAAAYEAAITLPAITVRTEKKRRAAIASQASPKPQNHFARNRHASPQAGLDNDDGFVPLLETARMWWPDEGLPYRNPVASNGGIPPASRLRRQNTSS